MVYESDRAVHEYLLTHYGNEAEQMPFDFGPRHATGFPRYNILFLLNLIGRIIKYNHRHLFIVIDVTLYIYIYIYIYTRI